MPALVLSACDPAQIIRDNPVYQTPMSNQECIKAAIDSVPEAEFKSQKIEMFRAGLEQDKKPVRYTFYEVRNSNPKGLGSVMIIEEQDGSLSASNAVIYRSFTKPKDAEYVQSVVTKVKESIEKNCGILQKTEGLPCSTPDVIKKAQRLANLNNYTSSEVGLNILLSLQTKEAREALQDTRTRGTQSEIRSHYLKHYFEKPKQDKAGKEIRYYTCEEIVGTK